MLWASAWRPPATCTPGDQLNFTWETFIRYRLHLIWDLGYDLSPSLIGINIRSHGRQITKCISPRWMRFCDDNSADLTGSAEKELFDVKSGQSRQIRQKGLRNRHRCSKMKLLQSKEQTVVEFWKNSQIILNEFQSHVVTLIGVFQNFRALSFFKSRIDFFFRIPQTKTSQTNLVCVHI